MTLEQQRAVALASARLRLQDQPAAQASAPAFVPSGEKSSGALGHVLGYSPQELGITPEENIAGHPVTRFAAGAASPFLGIAQLIAEAFGDTTGTETLKRFEAAKERGMKAMGGEGVDVAGLAGAVVSPAVIAATKIPAAASVLGRAGQGAAIGGALGAAAPVTGTDDYWAAKGAQVGAGTLLGGIIPPAIDLTRKVAHVGRNIIDPMLPGGAKRSAARLLSETAGAKRAAIEAQLEANRVLVTGSQPTAAEAAAPAGSAEFSGLQRVAEHRSPTAYADIAKAQEAARRSAIGGIAQDPAALKAAEASRSAEANQLYANAFEQATRADPELGRLAENPYFKDALPHAVKLAKSEGISAKANLTRFLHYVKLGLDKELSKTGDTALSATEKGAVQQVKKQLVAWMAKKNPAYDQARATFAAASKPINVMQVGQELEKSLTKPIGEGERAGVFAGAVREAPRTLKRATGQPRFQELEEVLDRGDFQTVKNVLADLSRKAEHDTLARLGQGKATEITSAFALPATGPLHQQYMIFKTVLGRVSRGVNEKTLDEISSALQVPANTLQLLRMAPTVKRNAVIDAIIQRKLGRGAIAAGTVLSAEGAQQ